MSTAVVPDGAPEEPISKPDEAESFSDTNTDAEDASCVDPSVASKSVKKKKKKRRGNSVSNKNNRKRGVVLPFPIPPARKRERELEMNPE